MYIIYINIKMKGDADLADTNSKFGLKKIKFTHVCRAKTNKHKTCRKQIKIEEG